MVFVVFVIASFTSRFRVGVDSFFHINHLIPCKPTCQALFLTLAKIFSSVLARKLYLFGAISGTQIVRVGAESLSGGAESEAAPLEVVRCAE